ncbi:MAG: VIT1/CCC1 transporter family protein [bacterium]
MNDRETQAALIAAQRNEITEHLLYLKLADSIRHDVNSGVLRRIADDELGHYTFWKKHTGRDAKPKRWKFIWYYWISRVFGLTFGIKLMEKGEEKAQVTYGKLSHRIPDIRQIVDDEDRHEHELLGLIDEERLKYIGSIVLGLNDALVELMGMLAGLTFALRNTRLVAVAGLITGISAAFSMASSEYLSTRSEGGRNPFRSSLYTWVAYIATVILLIFPYLFFSHEFICLGVTILNALLIILVFTFYIAVAKDLPFRKRFLEMAGVSLGVAALSFGIGSLVRIFLGVND